MLTDWVGRGPVYRRGASPQDLGICGLQIGFQSMGAEPKEKHPTEPKSTASHVTNVKYFEVASKLDLYLTSFQGALWSWHSPGKQLPW